MQQISETKLQFAEHLHTILYKKMQTLQKWSCSEKLKIKILVRWRKMTDALVH